MFSAVYDLTTARPHVREDRRLTPPEFRAYCEGYYMAISMAFQVMDLAVTRWTTARKARRDIQQKRSA